MHVVDDRKRKETTFPLCSGIGWWVGVLGGTGGTMVHMGNTWSYCAMDYVFVCFICPIYWIILYLADFKIINNTHCLKNKVLKS